MILAAASNAAVHQDPLIVASSVVNFAVLLIAVVVIGRGSRIRRTTASAWALAMFGSLAGIVGISLALTFSGVDVVDDGSLVRHGYVVVLISVLLLVPYFLVRFAHALGAVNRRRARLAGLLTAGQVAWTLFLPRFPVPGAKVPLQMQLWVYLLLFSWTVQTAITAWGLWRAGREQPSVVRHRMRVLSIGAMIVALSLVSSSAGGTDNPNSDYHVATTFVGVLGICLLVLAFVVPDWLRAVWRAPDLTELGKAERSLMAAVTAEAVGAAIAPALVKLFGAQGAALVTQHGVVVSSYRISDAGVAGMHAQLLNDHGTEPVVTLDDDGFACRMASGAVLIHAGAFAPLFGPAELALLDRVGSFVDLALQRCLLFEQEAVSRRAAEAANAELQTLVYSVSHDLRNPIISVLGYLDVLAQEHAGELQGEGAHYLERISVNAMYMQSLIQDLLELSRIGRSEPPPQAVSLGVMAESVAKEVRIMHPASDVSVSGQFPVVWMSDLRARQLLTNLVDNAAKHARGEAQVTVTASTAPGGGAVVLIADNGTGVPVGYREKAFEVFERLDAARSEIPGTGMGLPICKRIVESLGGSISLEGPQEGQPHGTVVRIVLPAQVVQGWHPISEASSKESVR